jgi:ABC-2 type transport system permease protein
MIAAVGIIVAKDLRQNLRNGFFLTVGIVAPLVLAVVFNAVFGSIGSGELEIPVGVIDDDRSEVSAVLGDVLGDLDEEGLLSLERLDPGADPATALADGLSAVVVVPDGFGAATGDPGQGPELRVVGDPDAPISVGIVRSVVRTFAQRSDRARIATVAALTLGVDPPAPSDDAAVDLVDRGAGSRVDPTTQITAAMASMFMLIVALLGVTSVLDERRDGTLARLLAAPIPRASVIVAKILVSIILGVITALALVVTMGVALGAEWGPPVGVAALVVAFSVAAAAFTVLVAGTANTAETAQNVQGSLAVVLAVLSGGLFPLPDSGAIGVARRLTPHHWFLDGLRSVATEGVVTAALPALGALAVFSVALGVPGLVLAQRRLTS